MKRKYLWYAGVSIMAILLIMTAEFALRPIAKIGDRTVRMYEFLSYEFTDKENGIEKMAEDIAFEKLIQGIGVTVTESEIAEEADKLKMCDDEEKALCRKTILHQKAIEKYASEVTVTADEARQYYETHKERYGGTEPEFEHIKYDIQMESGIKKYEESLERIMSENEIQILKRKDMKNGRSK